MEKDDSKFIIAGVIGFIGGTVLSPLKRGIIQIIFINIVVFILSLIFYNITRSLLVGAFIAIIIEFISYYFTRKRFAKEKSCFCKY